MTEDEAGREHFVPVEPMRNLASAEPSSDVAVAPLVREASRTRGRTPTVAILLAGALLTGLLSWAASDANHSSNARLLTLQTRQAAATLTAAIPSTQSQMADALQVATSTKSSSIFQRFVAAKVGGKAGFASISLWQRTSAGAKLLATSGSQPLLVADGRSAAFFANEKAGPQLHVSGILAGSAGPRLGFSYWPSSNSTYEVYAESKLPANRRIVVPSSSAFNDLNFALYLGHGAQPSQLIEASLPTPVQGSHAVASIPFGDSMISMVGVAKAQLTGGTSAALWWIVLIVGALLTLSSAATVEYISRRRHLANSLGAEIAALYTHQRSIAETLQRALLPEHVPDIPGMQIAVRYVPGTSGEEVGGDWYDIIKLDDAHFIFVVGDVSGRGVAAAAVMASLRSAGRGFAIEGHSPSKILELLSLMLNVESDRHMATVLCGLVDVERHEVILANAGHLPPVLCSDAHAEIVQTNVVQPIGVSRRSPITSTTLSVAAGSSFVAYTDGLIERRGQKLEVGITRLRELAEADCSSVDKLLDDILREFSEDAAGDDIAVIGLKWHN